MAEGKIVISSVNIKGFTVFSDVTVKFCHGINIIIGENGSGKTHLLKLLYCSTSEPETLSPNDIPDLQSINISFTKEGYEKIYFSPINATVLLKKVDFEFGRSIFIPAKEMLSHSKGLLVMADKYSKDMPFDKTLLDIIKKAQAWKPDVIPELAVAITPKLEKVIQGTVFMKDDNSFWVRKRDGLEIPFSMEAEGLRKFGLLWQLLMNESITSGTVLLWDEPEANLNPQLFSVLVDILLELSRNGVQIFLATHNYGLAKYFDVKKQKDDNVLFHSLYKTGNGVQCETADSYQKLTHNAIEVGETELYNAVVAQDIEVMSDE